MTHPIALHGDGINFAFFNLLWSKSSNDEEKIGRFERRKPKNNNGRKDWHSGKNKNSSPAPPLRVPDTVVFLFGQPHQWYFTSKNGGPDRSKITILRKRRANLTLDNIKDVFLNKAASRGEVGDDDVVAYFISSKNDVTEMKDEMDENSQNTRLDACSTVVDNEISCNIEYFNKKSLRKQLSHNASLFHMNFTFRSRIHSDLHPLPLHRTRTSLQSRRLFAAWKN